MIRIAACFAIIAMLSGCSGIKPWKPDNHREDGPTKGGLFTGPEGEWSIGFGGKVPDSSKAAGQKPSKDDAAVRKTDQSVQP